MIEQAVAALETSEIDVFAVSRTIRCAPVGPSRRCFANAAAVISTALMPPALLDRLQAVEVHFGRQRRGQRWQARTLDIDIVLWSGGAWTSRQPQLTIPHRHMQERAFVLRPACDIAADWRHPQNGKTVAQLFHRLNHAKPLDRGNTAL